ncbi:MAG: asparagine synthase (glutamine-hydrolyzing) [Acidobacteriia bacterium]|nr:asparagine synthase (glutamine-hydrolyzing) [Terriglobia bacterium]
MCGIAGIVTPGSAEALRPAAESMAVAMSHRGPDSQGVQGLGPCLLVNARLAIIDLSERGRQPMSSADGNLWITYNGETYNAAELRAEMEKRGHQFHSTTDTEVVLHLYQEDGERCVEKLRGMFAFAIWDIRAQKLVLARDRLGIKPLYFYRSGNQLVFASEIKALLASGLVPRQLDPAGLRVFLQLGHIPPPWTAIRGVMPLEPGHIAIWRDGEWRTETYWTLDPHASATPPPEHLAAGLADVLLDAMRNHLVSDVPVLMFLSGGTDSACLAAAARHVGAQNLSAMTVGFGEAEFDETELSRRTAHALDIPLQVAMLDAGRVVADLDHAIWALDQPSVDGLNSYWISKLAAEAGFKVALSGQGGDELFGGYESLAWFKRFTAVARWARRLPAMPFSRMLDQPALPFRWRKLSYLVGARDPFVASQMAVKFLFLDRDIADLLSAALGRNGHHAEAEHHLAYWSKFVEHEDLLEQLAFMDIHTHLEPRLLRDLDATSMAHSIEVRPVFLDHRLVEFLLPVPSETRIQQKRLLLEAARRFLPQSLLEDLETRRKRTFTFPFKRWLTRDMHRTMREAFSSERLRRLRVLEFGAVDHLWRRYEQSEASVGWSRIWSLFVLERWCEIMQVSP